MPADGRLSPGNRVEAAERADRLSQRPPDPHTLGIWRLAWPTVVGNLLMSITGIVDLKIVSSLGAPAVAGVGGGTRLFFAAQAILIGITAGTTALVARAWGAGDRAEAARLTRASVGLSALAAGAIALPGVLFAGTLTLAFRIGPEAADFAAQYIRIVSAFNVFFGIGMALSTALRAAGDVRTPLWVGALANATNLFLDYGLVYGELGMPRLGVAGAALATGLSFTASAAVLMALWLRGGLIVPPGDRPSLTRDRTAALTRIGYPAALEQVCWQGGFVGFLVLVGLYGTTPFAAYNIGVQLLSFSFVIGFGFSIAGSTLVGQHLGAGDTAGARRSGWRALRLSSAFMGGFGLLIIAAAEPLARVMIDEPEVVRLTVVFIYILGVVQPLMAVEFALGGALRGAGDTRFPLLTTFSGLIGARIGVACAFVAAGATVEWVFAALIADYAVKSTLLALRFRSDAWLSALERARR